VEEEGDTGRPSRGKFPPIRPSRTREGKFDFSVSHKETCHFTYVFLTPFTYCPHRVLRCLLGSSISVWGESPYRVRHTLLANALLSLTASEAAVERTFSRQGLIHSKLRNRLCDDSVQMQMFFSFNTRALEQPHRHHRPWTEEVEEEEEINRGTALLSLWQPDEDIVAAEEEGQEEEKERVLEVEEGAIEEDADPEEKYDEGEEKNGRSEEGKLQDFIVKYVADHNCTKHYRFGGHKSQQLEALLIAAGLRDTGKEVEKKIRKHCGEKEKKRERVAAASAAADD
jgi:hypothetical protein